MDFGFLSGLQGKDNWQQIRQDKQAAIGYQSVLTQQKERELAQQQKAIADANDYLSKLKNYQVFEPDLKKIRSVEEDAKQDIINQIKANGGDVAKWMRTTGMTDLNRYGNKIVMSNEAQTGLGNAQAYATWKADRDKGLLERFDFDEETFTPKGTFAEQFSEYSKGDRDRLDYKGAFKPNEFDEKYFSQVYGGADRYAPKKVGEGDYYDTVARDLVQKGMNPQDARQLASIRTANYKKHLEKNGTPLYYKWDKRPQPRKSSGENDVDNGMGIYNLAKDAFNGRADLIDPQGFYKARVSTDKDGKVTKQSVLKNPRTGEDLGGQQNLPEVLAFNGRALGKRSIPTSTGGVTTQPNLIQQVFIANRLDAQGKPIGKNFAVITDESRELYDAGSRDNPFVFYPTPEALTEAILTGSFSESGDATKTNKALSNFQKAIGRTGVAQQAAQPQQPKTISTKAEFDALPKGAIFIRNGKQFTKQ